MPKDFIHLFSIRLPFILLTAYFGTTLLGFYSMATTLSMVPIGIFAGALTKVLYQKFAENIAQHKPILPIFKSLTTKLFFAALPCFILLFLFASPLIEFLLSDEWSRSAVYFQIILPWMLIYFAVSPFDFIPNLFSKQKKAFLFDIAYCLLSLTGLIIGILWNNFTGAIILFSIAGGIYFLFLFFWYLRMLLKYEKSLIAK